MYEMRENKKKKLIMIANASKGNKFIGKAQQNYCIKKIKYENDKMINFCEKLRICRIREELLVPSEKMKENCSGNLR